MLFSESFILIIMTGLMSFGVSKYKFPCKSFGTWFNGEITALNVLCGGFAFIVFGFIDNAGLFCGGCYLDEVFQLLPGSKDANVKYFYKIKKY